MCVWALSQFRFYKYWLALLHPSVHAIAELFRSSGFWFTPLWIVLFTYSPHFLQLSIRISQNAGLFEGIAALRVHFSPFSSETPSPPPLPPPPHQPHLKTTRSPVQRARVIVHDHIKKDITMGKAWLQVGIANVHPLRATQRWEDHNFSRRARIIVMAFWMTCNNVFLAARKIEENCKPVNERRNTRAGLYFHPISISTFQPGA